MGLKDDVVDVNLSSTLWNEFNRFSKRTGKTMKTPWRPKPIYTKISKCTNNIDILVRNFQIGSKIVFIWKNAKTGFNIFSIKIEIHPLIKNFTASVAQGISKWFLDSNTVNLLKKNFCEMGQNGRNFD